MEVEQILNFAFEIANCKSKDRLNTTQL